MQEPRSRSPHVHCMHPYRQPSYHVGQNTQYTNGAKPNLNCSPPPNFFFTVGGLDDGRVYTCTSLVPSPSFSPYAGKRGTGDEANMCTCMYIVLFTYIELQNSMSSLSGAHPVCIIMGVKWTRYLSRVDCACAQRECG